MSEPSKSMVKKKGKVMRMVSMPMRKTGKAGSRMPPKKSMYKKK